MRPCKFKSENRRKNFNTNPNFAPRERFRFCQPKNSFPPVPIPPHQAFGLPQNACPYPRPRNVMNFFPPTTYPYISSPSPRFSFSSYENFPFSNISQGVRPEFLFQQRAQLLPENFSMHWPMVSPPPPPPPPPPLPPPLALMQVSNY